MTAQYLLTTNRITSRVRRETLDGREYLVAPVVAIVAGVLNGELVPVEEIGAYVESWNGRPVPLAHPHQAGRPVSANSPTIEASQVIGRFWNAELAGDRVRGEIWIDIEKARRMGGDALAALERIERGEGTEVSTAYFRDLEEAPGELNGQRYYGIARNLRPDHLALLLHELGACSWKDGCGVPRINQELGLNQHSGVMVALYPPADAAEALVVSGDALPDGAIPTPANEMHLTLAYLGDMEQGDVQIEQGEVLRRVMDWAGSTPIVRGMVSGVGRFTTTNAEGTQALFAIYECAYLQSWRWWLEDWLPVKQNKQFLPHITLAYLPADAPMPNVLPEPRELVFDRVGVAWGGQVTLFALQGEVAAAPAVANNSFNPFTMARNALRGLAGVLGIKTARNEPVEITSSAEGDPIEEVLMDRKQVVDALVANKANPFERVDLEAMSDGALQKLETALAKGCGGSQAPQVNELVTAELVIPEEIKQLGDQVKALSAALSELGGLDGLKAAIGAVQANSNQQKATLASALAANENCLFSLDELNAMSLDQLEKLSGSLRPANYGGRGGPRGNAKTADTVPAMQPVVLAKE